MEDLRLQANGIEFHALAEGPAQGPLVLLLHGFPELAISWTSQLEALGRAGFRAVAPDLRGYGSTSKQGPFDLETLAGDVASLIRALGRERATVVGHDWGGGVLWATAVYRPQVLERMVILNCPHPSALEAQFFSSPAQLLRSWYMFFFLIPALPEALLRARQAEAVGRSLRGGSFVREVWTHERTRPYQDSLLQPGAASAALGYYRSGIRLRKKFRLAAQANRIATPTLILWGMEDRFLGKALIEPEALAPWFAPGNVPEVRRFEGVGHFVQVEAPERVNAALLEWLGPPKST